MHTTEAALKIEPAVLAMLSEKIAGFIENAGPELAKAELRIADVVIDDHELRNLYGQALRDELRPRFEGWLYYVQVQDYTGRNGKKFVDVLITMKRGLLI